MMTPIMRRAGLLLVILLLFSCSARREARRQAIEEIKAMPREALAVHPVVNQIREFRDQLEEVQAVLDGQDPDNALTEAEASLRQLRADMVGFEDTMKASAAQMRSLQRNIEKLQRELEDRP